MLGGAVIYLTDILFEGPHSEQAVLSAVGPELTGQVPTEIAMSAKVIPPSPPAPHCSPNACRSCDPGRC